MAAMGRCVSLTLYGHYGALCLYGRYGAVAAMGRCVSLWPLWGAVYLYGRYGALWPLWGAVSPSLSIRYGALCISMAAMIAMTPRVRYGAQCPYGRGAAVSVRAQR